MTYCLDWAGGGGGFGGNGGRLLLPVIERWMLLAGDVGTGRKEEGLAC
jgi:hypothetical protein